MATEINKCNQKGEAVRTVLNVVSGVEIECYDETSDRSARVIIRNSTGHRVATVIADIRQGHVFFDQRSPEKDHLKRR